MATPLCSVYQRYNSKAIHNIVPLIDKCIVAVLSLSKIQFKSNSQLRVTSPNNANSCAQSIKDTIQKQFTTRDGVTPSPLMLCSVYQRYNSKAIHNDKVYWFIQNKAVLSLSKIQFKSNSQLRGEYNEEETSCAQSIKDTIQKQFTTMDRRHES